MNIVHVAHNLRTINGIAEVLIELTKEQIKLGHNVKILCDAVSDIYGANENVVKCTSKSQFADLICRLKPNIVIFHSLYNKKYPFYAKFLKKIKIPYAVEFHGAASINNRKKGYIKKSIADLILYRNFLKNSIALIYLNNDEMSSSVYEDFKDKAIIIPNGIHIPHHVENIKIKNVSKVSFLYLGRIDYIHKGLDVLIKALNRLSNLPIKDEIHFSFYGKGRDLVRFKSEISEITFADYNGVVHGEGKDLVLKSSDIMILTSRYEGMPMGILEALSYGCPCLITEATNMASVIKDKAGWVTPFSVEGIVETIHKAVEEYKTNREQYRNNSFHIAKLYEWSRVAKISIENYDKIVNQNDK
ncbi:MAG: glycosyltransferase [Bacteroidales bacterium]|nr:glycosyltransferase [Bacteroidales bacterium]